MSKEIHTQKHLTLSDRIFIEQALANQDPFKDIAAILKKDPSTISKEVRKHRAFKEGSHYNLKNNCALLSSCQRFIQTQIKGINVNAFSKDRLQKGCRNPAAAF